MTTAEQPLVEKYRRLTGWWRGIFIVFTFLGILAAVNEVFALGLFGILVMPNSYYYLLLTFYFSLVFLLFPLKGGVSGRGFFWLDVFLWFLSVGICAFLTMMGYDILWRGWGYHAPLHMSILSGILWFLIIEGLRRTSGLFFATFILVFSFYPLYASYMPGLLEGISHSLTSTAAYHALSMDSILGIPLAVFGSIMIGFLLFGATLQATGGGKFFINLAYALLGSTRGGAAKVSVLASAFFGSMSGSVISNVVTTGSFTIPAMKRSGYKSDYAGAIEACASTGGVLMPPVMGAVAFVMASFLDISYVHVAIAAVVPSGLYYLGLLVQVDGQAAKSGLVGLPKSEIPQLVKTLKEGWIYLVAMVVLLYFLFILRVIAQAPFYATAVLLLLAMIRKETRFTRASFLQFIETTGQFLTELISILAAVGLILGAFAITGVGSSFARELILFAGGNILFMLVLGAVASFILGMGMPVTACYVFLAIVLAPALVTVGLNEMAVHLFILYWGMVACITPPIAIAAFPAATLARSTPLKVGLRAFRLGAIIYIMPFFFILDPSLILQGELGEIVTAVLSAALAVFLIASAIEGHLLWIGRLKFGKGGFLSRIPLFVSGILLGLPGWQTKFLGLATALVILVPMVLRRLRAKRGDPEGGEK